MRILGMSRVTKQFQATIPKDVRKILGIREGDRVLFIEEDGKIFIQKG